MSKAMMLALPEVAYLVERIPIARVVIKADPIHLRFCQHARESRMPLKEQCRVLDIPWHARKITERTATANSLKAARITAPSVFVQTFPTDNAVHAKHWVEIALDMKDAAEGVRHWLAFNSLAVREKWADVKRYITSAECKALPMSLSPSTVMERATEWVAETERARAARMAEMHAGFGQMSISALRNAIGDDSWVRQTYLADYQRRIAQDMQNRLYYGIDWAGNDRPRTAAIEDRGPIQYAAPMLAPFNHGDLVVQLLNTYEQFADEGKRMHHCVETYFPRAKQGACRIVSVSTTTKRVATAEFTADWELIQVKGPANARIEHGPVIDALRAYGTHLSSLKAST